MEGMASVWSYQQSIEELKHSLLRTTLELESTQLAAREEKRRNEENVKQLLQLLKVAFQERDEAKDQLQVLVNKIVQMSSAQLTHTPDLLTESPPIIPSKGNSSFTETESLSETYNQYTYSSPVDSFFGGVASPDLSTMNMADSSNLVMPNQHFFQENNLTTNGVNSDSGMTQIDSSLMVIDRLAMKKPLPEKGKLLQAVMEAGPLLQTLLVAGPLPQWRNPPPLQTLQIPPISIKGHDSAAFAPKPTVNSTSPDQSSCSLYPHRNYNGASRACSTSVMNFSNTVSSSFMKKRPLLSHTGDYFANDPNLMGKRQRFQC